MFANLDLQRFFLGRLTLDAIPYHEPILVITFVVVAVIGAAVLVVSVRQQAKSPSRLFRSSLSELEADIAQLRSSSRE